MRAAGRSKRAVPGDPKEASYSSLSCRHAYQDYVEGTLLGNEGAHLGHESLAGLLVSLI